MLSKIQKNILIRALIIRQKKGEKAKKILAEYGKLTEDEKREILKVLGET